MSGYLIIALILILAALAIGIIRAELRGAEADFMRGGGRPKRTYRNVTWKKPRR